MLTAALGVSLFQTRGVGQPAATAPESTHKKITVTGTATVPVKPDTARVSVAVRALAGSARFYDGVLGALGYARLVERERTIGFGKRYPDFWINERPGLRPRDPGSGAHVCLRAGSAAAVDAFHAAALELGGGGRRAAGPARA